MRFLKKGGQRPPGRPGINPKSVPFVWPHLVPASDIPTKASREAQPLCLGQMGFTSAQSLLGVLALGDVIVRFEDRIGTRLLSAQHRPSAGDRDLLSVA